MLEKKRIKFGILCNSLVFEAWEADCINHLLQHPQLDLKLLVLNQASKMPKPTFLHKIQNYPYSSFLYRFYKRFFLKANSFKNISFEETFIAIPQIQCSTTKQGKYGELFSDKDVAFIQAQGLDFMLRFGFNIIKGDILKSCVYGIWSFHHADNDLIRGGPIGFWEIYLKQPTAAVVLQQLTNELDQGVILKKGYLKTVQHSYAENIDQLTAMSALWPLQVCLDLLHHHKLTSHHLVQTKKAKLYKYPANGHFLIFLLKLIKNKLFFHYEQLFRAESWQIACYEGSLKEVLQQKNKKSNYLSEASSTFYMADPFLWPQVKPNYLLFEYYSYKEKLGKIAMSDLHGKKFKILDFGLTGHLSYPFCFEHQQKVFCLPEQASSGALTLYEINTEGIVKRYNNLLDNFEARDASIVFYQNKWWLFCTKANYFENAALFIFYSASLDLAFVPHLNNPVKVDVRNARPAGPLIVKENQLLRPAQNSAKHYGHQVNINKIRLLTETSFEEEIIEVIDPLSFGKFEGIHHVASQNGYTTVDLKRYTFSSHNFRHQMKRKWTKLFR